MYAFEEMVSHLAQNGLELSPDPPTSTSCVLGLQVCATCTGCSVLLLL